MICCRGPCAKAANEFFRSDVREGLGSPFCKDVEFETGGNQFSIEIERCLLRCGDDVSNDLVN
jgi:hypothetical protein